MGRPSRLASTDLKSAILDAARSRFASEGYEAASMRRIADEAGCSATAIYLYFADKQTLMDALILEDFLTLAKAFKKLSKEEDPLARLRKMGRVITVFAVQHPNHYRLVFMTPKPDLPSPIQGDGRDTPEVNPYLALRQTLEEATKQKRFHKDHQDVDLLAQTFFAALHGVLSLQVVQFRDRWIPWRPLKSRVDLVLDTLIAGFAAKPAA